MNVHEAKTRLSELLALAEAGQDVVIARAGTPVARLEPFGDPPARRFGIMNLPLPDAFFDPLPAEEMRGWE